MTVSEKDVDMVGLDGLGEDFGSRRSWREGGNIGNGENTDGARDSRRDRTQDHTTLNPGDDGNDGALFGWSLCLVS